MTGEVVDTDLGGRLTVTLRSSGRLAFDDGTPVRAASALVALGDDWLVAQDDATHAAWWRADGLHRLRVLPPVEGLDVFSETDGTKRLKPDLEAACPVLLPGGGTGALLLGSGSTDRRRRGCLVRPGSPPEVSAADLGPLYDALLAALELSPGDLNVEGVCVVDDRLRVFARGIPAGGVPSASADTDVEPVLRALLDGVPLTAPRVDGVRRYEVGEVDGVGLAITDAVTLLGGRVLVSAAAEDAPNAVDDGPVVASALLLLDDDVVVARGAVPLVDGAVVKVEGLGVRAEDDRGLDLLAVVDDDDPDVPSVHLDLRVDWS